MSKRSFVLSLLIFLWSTSAFAQQQSPDVVYLKNGSVIKGKVVEVIPDETVKIETQGGSIFVYEMNKVRRIERSDGESAESPNPTDSDTDKLFLQAHFNGHGLTVEDADAESGSGFGVKLGYGFTQLFTGYIGIGAGSMQSEDPIVDQNVAVSSDYGLGYFDIGAQMNFRSGRALVPYADASLSGIAAVHNVDGSEFTFSGAGFSAGGGVKYFLSPVFALDGGLFLTLGSFSEAEFRGQTEDVDLGATGARFNLGFSWYPFK